MSEAVHSRVRARHCRLLAEGALSRRVADELLRIAEEFDAEALRFEWAMPTARNAAGIGSRSGRAVEAAPR